MNEGAQDFLGSIDGHWDDYRKQFKALRNDLSEESVHDLRVAARRFLALLGILHSLDRKPRVQRVQRFLKKQLKQLDKLHDAQVMEMEIGQNSQAFPELDAFHTYVQQRAENLGTKAHKKIRASKPSDLKKRVKRFRRVARRHSEDADLMQHLLEAVDNAHADTMQVFSLLNAEDPTTIHHIRVAFKKLRYMIETIGPLLQGYPEGYLDRMHEYQETMGRVHDTTLLLETLENFRGQVQRSDEGTKTVDVGRIEAYYRQRLAELVQAYLDRKDEIHMFWRAAPDQAFPWEKKNESIHRTARNRGAKGRQQQRSRRQPATPDRTGQEEVQEGGPRPDGDGDGDRPDHNFPVPTGG